MDHKVEERLHDLITEENYREADRVLREYLAQGGKYDDVLAICDADIGQNLGDSERIWAAIRQGLCFNPENYKLYVRLGNYYLDKNQEQSWLCYNYALSYCQDRKNQVKLQDTLKKLTICYFARIRIMWNT